MHGLFGSSRTLVAGRHDPSKERAAVPYPTPVTFPSVENLACREPKRWGEGAAPDFFKSYLGIRKLSDLKEEHLNALNIDYQASCGFEELLGGSQDASKYLPPISWLEPPPEAESKDVGEASKRSLLHNGRPVPNQQEFYTRIKELYHTNDEAFYALNHGPSRDKHAHPPIRLAHFRRFWEGLDNMAFYWDTSHDEYIPPAPEEHDETKEAKPLSTPEEQKDLPVRESHALSPDPSLKESRKRSKQHHDSDEDAPEAHHQYHPETTQSHSHTSHSPSSSFGLHPLVHSGHQHQQTPSASSTESNGHDANSPPPGTTYRGHRIGPGSSMPEQHRIDTVRSFVEPIAWSWGFTISPHRRPTTIAIKTLKITTRFTAAVWRVPKDRQKARASWLEGPIMGISCRSETGFTVDDDGTKDAHVRDVLREIGAMIVLAQERAREGKSELKAGEGKWWTTKPRWGGGPGGEVGEGRGVGDGPVDVDEQDEENGYGRHRRSKGKGTAMERKESLAVEAWKNMTPPAATWDPRVQYEAIGKNQGDGCDEVFLVSSLNHHVSMLKLRIHASYLEYLANGCLAGLDRAEEDWCRPVLQRTRWFDLFVAEDRAEAARGVWGVMAYLARTQGD